MSDTLTLLPELRIQGDALFAAERTIRRQIRRWWAAEPKRWTVWLMLNPSNAGAERNDPTALRVTNFSRSWGYDGWIGVNLYPLISSQPEAMWRWARFEENGPDWFARDVLMANLGDIEHAARLSTLRIVAFGAQPIEHDQMWLEECLEAFGQPSDIGADERLYCLGVNKTGQPLHPLARGKMRVPDGTKPILWRE